MINNTISPQNQFNLTSFLEGVIFDNLTTLLLGALNLPLTTTQRECVITHFHAAVNRTNLGNVINHIEDLRKVSTALYRIYRWYRFTFLPRLSNFRPINQCVERFITLRCAACTRNIPMLCRGVCSALIRGCFSSFQIGLRAQFNILWNVTRQIVRRGTNILQNLGEMERKIVNIDLSNDLKFLSFVSPLNLKLNTEGYVSLSSTTYSNDTKGCGFTLSK